MQPGERVALRALRGSPLHTCEPRIDLVQAGGHSREFTAHVDVASEPAQALVARLHNIAAHSGVHRVR
jgi:hypothetical protein